MRYQCIRGALIIGFIRLSIKVFVAIVFVLCLFLSVFYSFFVLSRVLCFAGVLLRFFMNVLFVEDAPYFVEFLGINVRFRETKCCRRFVASVFVCFF